MYGREFAAEGPRAAMATAVETTCNAKVPDSWKAMAPGPAKPADVELVASAAICEEMSNAAQPMTAQSKEAYQVWMILRMTAVISVQASLSQRRASLV
jgi:hypothetical protein